MNWIRSNAFQTAGVALLAAVWKAIFFFWNVIPFNSDEAVVALMARHILSGEFPVFFYGQAYMGSLDAFLVAVGFALFGQHVWVIRLVQSVLYLLVVLTTILLGRVFFGSHRVGITAGLLIAIPPVNTHLYTTASLGGYGEALFIGNLLLLVAVTAARQFNKDPQKFPSIPMFAWGLLAGVGLWANGLTLVYTVPTGLYLIWSLRDRWPNLLRFSVLAAGGILLGSLPWTIYAVANGPAQLIQELFGTAVAVEQAPFLERTASHLVNFLLLGSTALLGFRPPWEVRWLALPILPLALFFWLSVMVFFFFKILRKGAHFLKFSLLGGVCAVLTAGFLFTPFGVDPSGRYFLPMMVPLALVAAYMLQSIPDRFFARGWLAGGAIVLVLVYQFWGTLQSGFRNPPGLTTQFYQPTVIDHRFDDELIDFLRAAGERRGYANYWVSYPLAFQSSEELIFVPRLPYHLDLRYTPRDDRYEPYQQVVAKSEKTAYITTRNPSLDDLLRSGFTRLGVTWQEVVIGDYQVYYSLSRPVRPAEIGLGEERK